MIPCKMRETPRGGRGSDQVVVPCQVRVRVRTVTPPPKYMDDFNRGHVRGRPKGTVLMTDADRSIHVAHMYLLLYYLYTYIS